MAAQLLDDAKSETAQLGNKRTERYTRAWLHGSGANQIRKEE